MAIIIMHVLEMSSTYYPSILYQPSHNHILNGYVAGKLQ